MKTLLFSNLIPCKAGAFEHFVAALGVELRSRGDVLVAVFGGDPVPRVEAWLRAAGVRWETIPGWSGIGETVRPWRFAGAALRIVRREQPDVVALNFGNEIPATAVKLVACAVFRKRAKWVWQQHQRICDPAGLAGMFSRIRLVGMTFDHIVALYGGGCDSMVRRGVGSKKISIIPNGIPAPEASRDRGWLRSECGISNDALIAVSVGSLIARKRVEFLLEALALAPEVVHLVVCGVGSQECLLRRKAQECGLSRRIHWLGLRNDVAEIVRAGDFLVHAALAEASPYVIVESMAAGIPAVASSSGAIPEMIEDGVTGFVVGASDLKGLVERIGTLCRSEELRFRMGAAARARWQSEYREELCVRRYADLYRTLLQVDSRERLR